MLNPSKIFTTVCHFGLRKKFVLCMCMCTTIYLFRIRSIDFLIFGVVHIDFPLQIDKKLDLLDFMIIGHFRHFSFAYSRFPVCLAPSLSLFVSNLISPPPSLSLSNLVSVPPPSLNLCLFEVFLSLSLPLSIRPRLKKSKK